MTGAKPWERQAGEPDRDWRAFLRYRALPPSSRSIGRLVDAELAERTLKRMSSRWRWVERAAAYDRGSHESPASRSAGMMELPLRHEERRGGGALETLLDDATRSVRAELARRAGDSQEQANDLEAASVELDEWLEARVGPPPEEDTAASSLSGALHLCADACVLLLRRLARGLK